MKRLGLSLFVSMLMLLLMTSCSEHGRKRIHADWTKDPKDLYEYGCYLIAKRPRNFYTDYDEGRKYIERAANMGYREAMRKMGGIHAMGTDVKNLSLAVNWYSRAAEAGERNAMIELENAYRYGQLGLQVDAAKADYWHRRFVEQGIKDEDQQLAPWVAKAEQGDRKSMEFVARSYENRGEDYWKPAVEWYARAGNAGSTEASMRLVQAYREGQLGLSKDETKSNEWFRTWQQAMREKSPGANE